MDRVVGRERGPLASERHDAPEQVPTEVVARRRMRAVDLLTRPFAAAAELEEVRAGTADQDAIAVEVDIGAEAVVDVFLRRARRDHQACVLDPVEAFAHVHAHVRVLEHARARDREPASILSAGPESKGLIRADVARGPGQIGQLLRPGGTRQKQEADYNSHGRVGRGRRAEKAYPALERGPRSASKR